ncbi:MAG: hypothetical protein Tsb002_23290 [Wenzhouxiangellaceae bacterium]
MKSNLYVIHYSLRIMLVMLLSACASREPTAVSADDDERVIAGWLEQARAQGVEIDALIGSGGQAAGKHWRERLDGGDAPLIPGCACYYEMPACGGRIVGRAVDECWPRDGVTLQEKVIDNNCDDYGNKTYNCEELLGEGATCRLIEMDCCGVATTSAYCHIEL